MTRKSLVPLLFVLSATPLAHAQMNLGKLKPQIPAKTDANGQTQYSDADKTKMAEIAQRPEVQAAVETAWNDKRTLDLNDAYLINQTADWSISENPMVSKEYDPREKRLYNNPMMQMYINQIGQRLVPKHHSVPCSGRLFADHGLRLHHHRPALHAGQRGAAQLHPRP